MSRLALVCIVVVGIVGVVFGQPQSAARSTLEELLTEVRGLRAEISQAASASIRTQLLVARLSLQEQRINVLTGQLAQVQRELAARAQGNAMTATRLKVMEKDRNRGSAEQSDQVEQQLTFLKAAFEQEEREEQQMRQREAALAAAVAEEQARWTDFNSRLDELERSLTAR